jgi:hypothetical protein
MPDFEPRLIAAASAKNEEIQPTQRHSAGLFARPERVCKKHSWWLIMKKEPVIAQIAGLKEMSVDLLKKKWRELYDTEPPPFNRAYLESRLAYRIQELSYGGLPKETKRRIVELKEELLDNKPRRHIDPNRPPIGAILVREFQGVEHRVRVLADGFEYQGRSYKSLSALARIISGTNWSGPMFFGLRNRRGYKG